MSEPLHPSNLGEILDRTVQLYRSWFLVFFGIAVIPAGVTLELVAILPGVVVFFAVTAMHVQLQAPWSYIGLGLIGICVLAGIVLFMSMIYASLLTALAVLHHDQRLRKDGLLPAPPQARGIV